ncbi:MAG TPA: serine/threonine-protein kinase, partial [Nocardioidaceae bacterium]|nr:serine/threonine-protein kinase [Nocardioidaceae bacterium]
MSDDARLLAGRYRLEFVLGRGGMGKVWRAQDEILGRPVAVKEVIFPPGVAEHDRNVLCDRTLREARLTAQLNHPGIITTYDVVSEEARPFIVMELLEVPSLADEIERHSGLPPQRVAEIGLKLLGALETAHRAGIVHRDVKPSNVLLADGERVVLTDFGIATSETDPSLTSTGVLIGSPTYMAPERLRGEVIGTPADLWSLGATLYAALQGQPPFRADTTMGTITAVLADEVEPPQVHGPLRAALLGMLEKAPAQRLTVQQSRPLLQQALEDRTTVMAAPVTDAGAADVRGVPPVLDGEPAYDEDAGAGSSGRRTGLIAVVVALALAAVLAAAVLATTVLDGGTDQPQDDPEVLQTDPAGTPTDDPTDERTDEPTDDPTDEPTDEPTDDPTDEPTDDPTDEPTDEPTDDETEEPGSVPAGYELQEDPLGFQVAVPEGWERQLDSPTRVDFVSPDGTQFLRIDQRAQALPDAEEAWLDLEPAVEDSLPGYDR